MLRHQKIESLTARRDEEGANADVGLWTKLAAQLIPIIGVGGFDSLYARSVYLSQSSYPWLVAQSGHAQTGHRFADLQSSLQAKSAALAREANRLLLITFTDILVSLIGEPLTARILDSAWGNDAQETAGKEFNDE